MAARLASVMEHPTRSRTSRVSRSAGERRDEPRVPHPAAPLQEEGPEARLAGGARRAGRARLAGGARLAGRKARLAVERQLAEEEGGQLAAAGEVEDPQPRAPLQQNPHPKALSPRRCTEPGLSLGCTPAT